MTSYTLRSASPAKTRADVVVVGVLTTDKGPEVAEGGADVAAAYGRKFRPLLAQLGFTGKAGESVKVPTAGTIASPLLVLVGLGEARKLTPVAVRRAAGVAARSVSNAATVALALPSDSAQLVRAVTEGYLLGGYTFTDYKQDTKDEKKALLDVMALEDSVKEETGPRGVLAAMKNGKVWYFTVIYFCLQIAVYGVTFYLPQQVAQLTGQKVGFAVGMMAAIPWFFGIFACYFIGKAANTVIRRRNWGTALFISTGLCIFGSAWAGANQLPVLGIIFITLAVCSFLSIGPIAWSFPTAFLTGTAAAAGIGLINSLGNLGGFVAPILRTSVNQMTASDTGTMGVYALGVLPFLAAAMMFATRRFKNKADELLEQEPSVQTGAPGSK